MNLAQRIVHGADRAHQRRPWIAFPYAVVKKFGDDQAGNLAALVSYYGFFSLFPLMLVLVTVLGMVLQGNVELQRGSRAPRSRTSRSSATRSRATCTRCEGAGSRLGSVSRCHFGRDSAS